MIKMVEVDNLPEKGPPMSEIVDNFVNSNLAQVRLDLEDEDRPKQIIYNGLYQSIKGRGLNVRVKMIDGEIYLQRLTPQVEE